MASHIHMLIRQWVKKQDESRVQPFAINAARIINSNNILSADTRNVLVILANAGRVSRNLLRRLSAHNWHVFGARGIGVIKISPGYKTAHDSIKGNHNRSHKHTNYAREQWDGSLETKFLFGSAKYWTVVDCMLQSRLLVQNSRTSTSTIGKLGQNRMQRIIHQYSFIILSDFLLYI